MESKLDQKDEVIMQLKEEISNLKHSFGENERKEIEVKKSNMSVSSIILNKQFLIVFTY